MRYLTMNRNRPIELHYINTGFPYTVTESIMNLFEGLTYEQSDPLVAAIEGFQENAYWQSYSGSYKYGPGGNSYFGYVQPYEVDDNQTRIDATRMAFENSSTLSDRDPTPLSFHEGGNSNTGHRGSIQSDSTSQINFQDNINPDTMTYEELLDLGEAIGSHSRGLSKERIALLPVSKYKKGSFLIRKRSRNERCVICQMNYKRRERLITLPCKHMYHADCCSRWLSINKVCPICYAEVTDVKAGK